MIPSISSSEDEYYRSLQFIKKGRWATYPADAELWHSVHTSRYFEEIFGVWREILAICVFDKEYSNHMYVPESFVKKLHARINYLTSNDHKPMEKILLPFYEEKKQAKREIPKINPSDISILTNNELADTYARNRNAAHRIVAYDQFTWLAEDYWISLMDQVLIQKLGLVKCSPDYNDVLFALTKPREISTTLEEKRSVTEQALRIQSGNENIKDASVRLAKEYGWMPVLAYGIPWDANKYAHELENVMLQDRESLNNELSSLQNYTGLRDADFEKVVKKYKISLDDLQIFIDFGLAIDVRNEAEYVASVAGFYMLPLYDEMIKRLDLSIIELRTLYETEIIACLKGEADARAILASKGRIRAWGLDGNTKQKINFFGEEAEKLFAYVEEQQMPSLASDTVQIKKGITASRGKVRGRVKLVPTPDDNYKVEKGDILIAYSTMVDNLPAMKKAAAFVTESGGLTCHAAVVAREFGIPCIVSLKNAMSDFKDGDMVEVDADNGIVKIV